MQVNWKRQPDALPKLPAWAAGGKTWAPEVVQAPDGGATPLLLWLHLGVGHVGSHVLG